MEKNMRDAILAKYKCPRCKKLWGRYDDELPSQYHVFYMTKNGEEIGLCWRCGDILQSRQERKDNRRWARDARKEERRKKHENVKK